MKVFLGGTCNKSLWRDGVERVLTSFNIDFFNPVVKDWTPKYQEEERLQRNICDFVMYTITPRMSGVYSIAEVVDDSNKRPEKTILVILNEDYGVEPFSEGQLKSLKTVGEMVIKNGGAVFYNLLDACSFLVGKNK